VRKRAAFGALLAIALGVVGFYAISPAGSAPRRAGNATSIRARTIRVYEHDTAQNQIGKGDNLGDRFIYSGDLFDRKGGKNLGRVGGDCETMSAGPHGETVCTGNFMLPGGQIITQGLFDTAGLFGGGKTLPWAITGGTGIYRNARGYGTVLVPPDVPSLADADFVFYLS